MKKKFLILLTLILTLCATLLFGCDCGKPDEELEPQPQAELTFVQESYSLDRYSIIELDLKNAGEQAITWSSSDENVAKVIDGKVFGCAQGSCTITAVQGEQTATCSVAVSATEAFLNLKVSQETVELLLGGKKTLNVSLKDNNKKEIPSAFYELSFVPSNDFVSTENGVITAKEIGTSTVTVTVICAGRTLVKTVEVTVKESLNISFNKTVIKLFANSLKGEKQTEEQLNLYVYENGNLVENPTITYSSEEVAIATVNQTGMVKAVTEGNTKISAQYVSAKGTPVTATIDVEVAYPVVTVNQKLDLEVCADSDSTVNFAQYSDYFDGDMTNVVLKDDLGHFVDATISNDIVTIDNAALSYGFRTLEFIINGQIKFAFESEIVTKIITEPEQLADFAVTYGGRGADGSYEGYFVLGCDINMTEHTVKSDLGNEGATYLMCNDDLGFKGIFDGKGHTIYNLTNKSVFGRVSKNGVIKNVGFFTENNMEYGVVAGIFGGTLENVYIRSNLANQSAEHYSSIAYRAIGSPEFINVVVDVIGINDVVQSSLIYETQPYTPNYVNVYLITPNETDPILYKNSSITQGNVIHYTQSQADKDFSLLDKTSGYWETAIGGYKFKTSAHYDLSPLATPDTSTFNVNGEGTLTWGAIDGADGYILLINGSIVKEVATNSYPNFVQGAVRITAKGNGTSSRDSAQSEVYSYFDLEEDYVADFAFNGYEALVGTYSDENDVCNTPKAEYLTSFEGETNVLKITLTSARAGKAGFILKLPKDPGQNKIQVKMYNQCSIGQALFFIKPGMADEKNALTTNLAGATKNAWTVQNIDYSGLDKTDEIVIYTYAGDAGQQAITIYLSWVKSVNIAGSLEEGYLADFSKSAYEDLVSPLGTSSGTPTVEAEYMTSFEGETNVLKIVSNKGGNGYTNFKLTLPKPVTTDKIQVRMYVAGITTPAGMKFTNPTTDGTHSDEDGGTNQLVKDAWHTYEVDYSSYDAKDALEVCAWHANEQVTFYLAWVKVVENA